MQKLMENQKIELASLDNPGWALRCFFENADESLKKQIRKEDKSEKDWIDCWLEGNSFFGYGGILNLEELVLELEKATSLKILDSQSTNRLEKWLDKFKVEPDWYHSSGFNLTQTRNSVELSVCLDFLDWQKTYQKLNVFFCLKTSYSYIFDENWIFKISSHQHSLGEVIECFLELFEDEEIIPYE